MIKKLLAIAFVLIIQSCIVAQGSSNVKWHKKATFSFAWGYNRSFFAPSTIHLRNVDGDKNLQNQYGYYDFKVVKAVAHDKPDFDKIPDVVNISVPQYNYRLGCYLNDTKDLGFEISFDHAKYIVDDSQMVHVKGQIFGREIDKDTLLVSANFLHFEHTDGANFLFFNAVKRFKLLKAKNPEKFALSFVAKAGAGIVIPRTDVTLFGNRINNNFHIAGTIVGVDAAVRIDFLKHGFIEFENKFSNAWYAGCLVQGKGHGKASHVMNSYLAILTLGYQFKLSKKACDCPTFH